MTVPLQTLGNPSLADLKQQAWWSKAIDYIAANPAADTPERRRQVREHATRQYGKDYRVALACHSLVWAAITFLPLCAVPGWSAIVAANAAVHYLVDDLKANRFAINLIQDQFLHLLQIGLTLGAFWVFWWLFN